MEQIKFYTEKELQDIFTALEKKSLINTSKFQKKLAIRNEALFKVMYYCALRISEATALEVSSYDYAKKQIFCKRMKGGLNNTIKIIDENILFALNQHIKFNQPKKYLFENFQTEKHISRKTCDQILKKLCCSLSIPRDKWHCHVFRHTRAIHLAELGLDSKDIQFWLGHVDIKNTYVYFRYTTIQEKQLYKKMKKEMKQKKFNESTALNYLKDSNYSQLCLQELASQYNDAFAIYILNQLKEKELKS